MSFELCEAQSARGQVYTELFQFQNIFLSILWYVLNSKVKQTVAQSTLPAFSFPVCLFPIPFMSLSSPCILFYHFSLYDGVWWSGSAYGEIWHLDRWLSHRLMSISARIDNSDSLTMNFSMSKHKACTQTQSQQWWTAIRQVNNLSYMGKHKHQ